MKYLLYIALLLSCNLKAATFQFNFGTGFSDATPTSPIGGNAGTTLGQQRQILFQAVAAKRGARIQSNVNIVVDAEFVPLTPCTNSGAVLGSAGPTSLHSGFPSQPIPNTFYPRSLVDAIRGTDNNPGVSDITARFNSDIDNGCLAGNTFYYGINGDAPPGMVQLFSTVLHELGHGLGFVSLGNQTDGSFPNGGIPAIFDRFVFDTQLNMPWTSINNAQRLTSMTNDPFLVWNGTNVTNDATNFISSGFNSGLVRLHAPGTIQPGSSVSHFSSAASADLLMEPVLGNIAFDQVDLTPSLFKDLGYVIVNPANNIIFANSFE